MVAYFNKEGMSTTAEEYRVWRFFEGIKAHFELLFLAFKHANATINITVSRMAIPVILRTLFRNSKTVLVWHYFDENDGKSLALKVYYKLLFYLLKIMPENKVAIIVVAPFWLHFFKTKTGKNSVFLFPNFFEKLVYDNFNKSEKVNQIHLGQYSFKNDAQLNELAKKLHYAGYHCYFSTNNKQEAMQLAYHEICFFESFEAYLLQMAQSKYTLALTSINEGWNRVAHESLLLGTQVIGYKKGGLGDLLTGANAIIVNTIDEAYSNIINNKHQEINREFLSNFQKSDSNKRILEIIKFLIIN